MKTALCIRTSSVSGLMEETLQCLDKIRFFDGLPLSILDGKRLSVEDRAFCETDTTRLQLIPYNVIFWEGLVLAYRRGRAGNENRLHDLWSIGVGGHIDTMPPGRLADHIQAESNREVKEELGQHLFKAIDSVTHAGFLLNLGDPVGSVHFGIVSIWRLSKKCDPTKLLDQESCILDASFVNIPRLHEMAENMEPWSKILVDKMFPFYR